MPLTAQTILERNRLFRGLPAATIERISALAIRRSYKNGATVFYQTDPGDCLFGVVTGRVRISSSTPEGKELFLNIMEPGDAFGEIALLDGQPRTATAKTTAPTELVMIMRDHFLSLLLQEPKLTNHLFQLLCQRIRWTSGLAEDSALLSVPARLARRLFGLGKLHGQKTLNGLHLSISQEELGRFAGSSRQVVNQYLQSWKEHGWVRLGRGKITILDEKALQAIVSSAEFPPNERP
jgi:CRP/FNR family transcriptional regulator, cyclic AMP receptor protein